MLSLWILALTAVTLFWVALTDLREFKVRNEFVAILAGLFVAHALSSGAWVSMQWNFAFALLMLAAGAYAYSLQQIGGGDLKLLAVAFLWTGTNNFARRAFRKYAFFLRWTESYHSSKRRKSVHHPFYSNTLQFPFEQSIGKTNTYLLHRLALIDDRNRNAPRQRRPLGRRPSAVANRIGRSSPICSS
jgi:hypothetical protein